MMLSTRSGCKKTFSSWKGDEHTRVRQRREKGVGTTEENEQK